MNQIILEFERHTGLGPVSAARLLGVAYPTYNQVRNGSRAIQTYTCRHIQALTLLPDDSLSQLIKEHAANGRPQR